MKLLFFDTETTGKAKDINAPVENLSNWPRLVQLAWQVYDDNQNLIEEYDFIVKPSGFTIPLNASEIHKITNEKANLIGTDIIIVLQRFHASVSSADLLIAHNFSFDYGVMGSEFLRNNLTNILSSKDHICTMKSSTDFCKINGPYGYKWPTLPELYLKLFNEIYIDHHNALEDSKATARCFWKLKNFNVLAFTHTFPKEIEISTKNQIQENLFDKTLRFCKEKEFTFRKETLQFLKEIFYECEARFLLYESELPANKYINQCRKFEYYIYCYYYIDKAIKKLKNTMLNFYYEPIPIDEYLPGEIQFFYMCAVRVVSNELVVEESFKRELNIINDRFIVYSDHDNLYKQTLEDHQGMLINNSVYNYVFFNSSPLKCCAKINSDKYALKQIRSEYPVLDDLTDLFWKLGFPKRYDWMSIS